MIASVTLENMAEVLQYEDPDEIVEFDIRSYTCIHEHRFVT